MKREKETALIIIWSLVLLLIGYIGLVKLAEAVPTKSIINVGVIKIDYEGYIAGLYSVKHEINRTSNEEQLTAEIIVDKKGLYKGVIVGAYKPLKFEFSVDEKGNIQSIELGNGRVEIDPTLRSVKISFINNGSIWRLEK